MEQPEYLFVDRTGAPADQVKLIPPVVVPKEQIEAEAERLRVWLGDRRVLPRFATPMVRELAAEGATPGPTPRPRTLSRRNQTRRPG